MKYLKFLKVILSIALIISAIITIAGMYLGFFGQNVFYEIIKITLTKELEILFFFSMITLIIFIVLNILSIPVHIIKIFLSVKTKIDKKYIDTKQSIYTRDLPEYNSAIAGEIIDFKTKFEQEYIAGVIELINKGYIIEKENTLIVDKSKSTEKLLENEKYILNTCENIYQDSYLTNGYQFYKKVKEDMINLGFYNQKYFFKIILNKIEYLMKKHTKMFVLSLYIILIILIFNIINIVVNIVFSLNMFLICYVVIIYMNRKSKLTKLAELEKEKMGKLKLFLEKETNFKDKDESERELWGRYSAFAVAFGLNNEMKEEIKAKIIKKRY